MILFELDKIEKSKIKEYQNIKQNNVNLPIILVISIIVIFIVLFSQLVCYCTNPLSIQQIYAQNSDVIESVKKEQPVNETKLLASYNTLIANNYPYPIHYVEKINPGPAIIYNGIVMLKNSKPEDAHFSEWGMQRNLNLYNYPGPNQNISLFNIDGNSRDYPSGFMSSPLQFADRYISLNIGSVYKYPESAQITIQLEVVGDKNEYFLNFVNGRLGYEGWLENTYTKKITSNSSQLIDLAELISFKGDKYLYLDRINVNVEKDTEIGKFQFRIDPGKSTINTPTLIDDGLPYFVNGYVFQNDVVSNDYSYSFDDWQFKQILNQEFISSSSDNHLVVENNWDIKEVTKSKDNLTNNMHIKIVSERNLPLWDAPIIDVLTHYNMHNSLKQFGSPKDILFAVTVVLLTILAFYKRKTISILK